MKGRIIHILRAVWRKIRIRKRREGVFLSLDGLRMGLEKQLTSDLPYEVTIVVPRAEIRVTEENGCRRVEVLMNSITIAHSPRFPPGGPR